MNDYIELKDRGMTHPSMVDNPGTHHHITQAYASSAAMEFCPVTTRCRPGYVPIPMTTRSGPSELWFILLLVKDVERQLLFKDIFFLRLNVVHFLYSSELVPY